jgi:hypothetical protein
MCAASMLFVIVTEVSNETITDTKMRIVTILFTTSTILVFLLSAYNALRMPP